MAAFITASELAAATDLRCVVAVSEAREVIALVGEAIETTRGKRAA